MVRPPERAGGTLAAEPFGYTAALMAVPKRKTSKARRDKRRATHAIEAPRVNVCPQCGSPKRAHRICPTCGTYKGREVEPLRLQAP
jgi:large subunit ribosomal protein L32